ncbi:MAG: SEC-C domain-containing protein [Kofleriaceae bacterium]|nr:SEC-C domain-containing protein [Kofleriaceae bacterium]
MPATVVDAVRSPFPCVCRCHERLSLDERAAGIAALFRFEDAMRGWGYEVVWDLAAPTLWRIQQKINNNDIRWVAVRDTGCIHSRLLGYCVHETIHALVGDTSRGNYGVPFGVPYGVPDTIPVAEEANYLAEFNWQEARAWAGMAAVGYRLFGIEWTLSPARDVGTYGFSGGLSMVDVPPGYRRVLHLDSESQPRRYYAQARVLEEKARDWFTPERLDEMAAAFAAAEQRGRELRTFDYPAPRELARIRVTIPGRNDLCICGSMRKWKHCCAPKYE